MAFSRLLLVAALSLGAVRFLHATQDVTAVNTTFTPGSPSTSEGYTFQNGTGSLTSFATSTNTYAVTGSSNNVFIRRNAVNNNQSSVWYTSSGTGTNLTGSHQTDYGQLLHSNNIYAGSDNTFANGTSTQSGNIERIDFTWNSGLTVSNALAFAVFDRGAVGVHDSFAIAAVTAIDAFGNPTAYGAILRVGAGWGGAINPVADQNYRLFRYANGSNISLSTDSSEVNIQGIGGIVITAADLGLTNGTTIYGYSLMAVDVTAANSAQLLDWTNGTYFPTTTDGNTGGGGIDLAALNGMAFAIVPEPISNALLVAFIAIAVTHYRKQKTRGRP